MTVDVKVPVLAESVPDATLLEWRKQPGDAVDRDEILIELETDKIVLEVPAPEAGVLTEVLKQTGDTVLSQEVLARIEPGAVASGAAASEIVASGAAASNNAASGAAASDAAGSPDAAPRPAGAAAPEAAAPASTAAERLSPAVRRLVEEHGLDPSAIPGTGRDGRITKGDVLAHLEAATRSAESGAASAAAEPRAVPTGPEAVPTEPGVVPTGPGAIPTEPGAPARIAPPASASAPTPVRAPGEPLSPASPTPASGSRDERREPMSRLRRRIAERLVEAQHTAAILTTFNEIDMQPVMALRARHKEGFERRHGVRLGFMSFFARAAVQALRRFPAVNARIDGDDIVYHDFCDIGVAVGSPRGLVVPILRNVEAMSFAEIEARVAEFGAKARDGTLSLDDMRGGTFTLSNGGVFGSMLSTPILNPPQSGILGMHKTEERPVVVDGAIVIRPMMYVALSYDHRIIDGREAVQFLVCVKEAIEDPARLLLDV